VLLPLGVYLAGFCLLVVLHLFFSHVFIGRLDQRLDNARKLLRLGEAVAQQSLRIEADWYRLATTTGIPEQQKIRDGINLHLAAIRTTLQVGQHGGSLNYPCPLTGDSRHHALNVSDYIPDREAPATEDHIRALADLSREIEEKLAELSHRLAQREQHRERSDRSGIFLSEGMVKNYLKSTSAPLLNRLHHESDTLIHQTHLWLEALQTQSASQRRRYLLAETLLAVGIVTLVCLLALLLARQHLHSTRQVATAGRELHEAHQLAQEANRLKSDFLANMSHEIRTPMNAIIGLSAILLEGRPDPSLARHIRTINQSAETLLRLLNDILDFSKIEAGQLEIEYQPLCVNEVLENVLRIFADTSRRKGVELFSRLDPRLPEHLVGDALRLQQILTNLVSNAFKFTTEGEILIEAELVREEGEQLELLLRVRDSGIGIAAEKLETIFGQFRQADPSIARLYGGTGLGLSISRRLCQLMGGDIRAESSEGYGSIFTCTVVCRRADADDGADEADAVQFAASTCVRPILLVHGRETGRIILREALERWGFSVISTGDAHEATKLLHAETPAAQWPQLALLDQTVAVRASVNLLTEVDSSGRDDLKILLLVSTGDETQQHDPGSFPQVFLMPKPFLLSELKLQLHKILENTALPPNCLSATPSPKRGLGSKILLTEDNSINAEIAHHILEQDGFLVDWAETGWDALRLLDKYRYDAVLMDVQMPELDGHATTAIIRACEGGSVQDILAASGPRPDEPLLERLCRGLNGGHMPILALTAHATHEDRQRCRQAGMDGYLTKPFKTDEMLAAIHHVINKARNMAFSPTTAEPLLTDAVIFPTATDTSPPGDLMERIKVHLRSAFNLPDDKVATMLPAFLVTLQGHMGKIEELFAAADLVELSKAAHTLKGALLNLGLKELADIAYTIECRGKAQDIATDFQDLVSQLRQGIDAIR